MSAWNSAPHKPVSQPQQEFVVSHDGINNLKGKFNYDQQATSSSSKQMNLMSSHENHLFNNRNAQQIIINSSNNNNSNNQYKESHHENAIQYQIYDDDEIAASDL